MEKIHACGKCGMIPKEEVRFKEEHVPLKSQHVALICDCGARTQWWNLPKEATEEWNYFLSTERKILLDEIPYR